VIVDYHVHLRGATETDEGPLEHTLEAIERYVEAAGRAGVDEVGFTEHFYYFREFGALLSHPYYVARLGHQLDSYCRVILEAKVRGLPVKLGLEVDYLAGARASSRPFSSRTRGTTCSDRSISWRERGSGRRRSGRACPPPRSGSATSRRSRPSRRAAWST
jgi:hypothetical protein